MARQRSNRRLILDRIDRSINAVDENERRLGEIIGFLQETDTGEDDSYTEEQSEVILILELTKTYREVLRKLYTIF